VVLAKGVEIRGGQGGYSLLSDAAGRPSPFFTPLYYYYSYSSLVRLSQFGGLDLGLDSGTGLTENCAHRLEAAHTLLSTTIYLHHMN